MYNNYFLFFALHFMQNYNNYNKQITIIYRNIKEFYK